MNDAGRIHIQEPGLRLVDRILGPLDLDAGPLGTREEALYASRLLCCLAIFAFITFAAVDPFVADGSLRPLLLLRALLVFGGLCTLAST